ncbi:hypothetical protein KCV87_00090 [Actinosynnema pretiosum subsp. pretiosum]|uniref:Methyl-accepting transducer domain-containing protein n=1 Tax=Actinosynnema pretiosum subsp. pretiosum TaxID=103721 RepID=A0AA45R473_9PSEU|nr:hypothetical protein KCV87_00090 [Actinosynnema pretiosum subsp. pretiosum]
MASMFVVPPRGGMAQEDVTDFDNARARVMTLWSYGGEQVQAEAAKALVGTEVELQAFLKSGYRRLARVDERIAVNRVRQGGGLAIQEAGQKALDAASSGDSNALAVFLDEGWRIPAGHDLRIRVNQMMTLGGDELRRVGQVALDANSAEALRRFVDDGWRIPYSHDLRIRVNREMAAGGPEVKRVGQRALDTNNVDAYRLFLDEELALAQARDMETATVAELAGVAEVASEQAAKETAAARTASERAVTEATMAREAAEEAARATDAAKGNADEAAAAAGRAADAANKAGSAAKDAVGAANTASSAAWTAAAAASRAAAAASLAGEAASQAYHAAAGATVNADEAAGARQAAQKSRDVAAGAERAADAAEAAADAGLQAGKAALAAASAGENAMNAANAAADAATYAQAAGVEAKAARDAAATARAAAARANRAANAAVEFAKVSANAAHQAKTAARNAAANARAAADAADKAAEHAGKSADAANEATRHANAATEAARVATDALTGADEIYTAARRADEERLAVRSEEISEAMSAMRTAMPRYEDEQRWDKAQVFLRDVETKQLIADATKPGVDSTIAVRKGREAALRLHEVGGSWTAAAATGALEGTDSEVLHFLTRGLPVAVGQDDRVTLRVLANTGTDAHRAAARAALEGSDADVERFLLDRSYPTRDTDDRIAVLQLLEEARSAGRTTTEESAQEALDSNSGEAYRAFLSKWVHISAGHDDRIAVGRILADAASGPEIKAAARNALDGPAGALKWFLDVGRHSAAQRDHDTALHLAEVTGLLTRASEATSLAWQRSDEAQALAATARGSAEEAAGYANHARESASQAAEYAKQASQSAVEAQQSAESAAEAARTARSAADSANRSARNASQSAVWAWASAKQADEFSYRANESKKQAFESAILAGKDAEAALAAADEAMQIEITKETEELVQRARNGAEQCRIEFEEGSPVYDECINLVSASSDELVQIAYQNAQICQLLYQGAAGGASQSCLEDVLSPGFEERRILKIGGAFMTIVLLGYSTAVISSSLVVGAIGCGVSQICGGALMALSPEGAAFTPWMAVAANTSAAAVAGIRVAAEIETALVESRVVGARAAYLAERVVTSRSFGSGCVGRVASRAEVARVSGVVPFCLSFNDFNKVLLRIAGDEQVPGHVAILHGPGTNTVSSDGTMSKFHHGIKWDDLARLAFDYIVKKPAHIEEITQGKTVTGQRYYYDTGKKDFGAVAKDCRYDPYGCWEDAEETSWVVMIVTPSRDFGTVYPILAEDLPKVIRP